MLLLLLLIFSLQEKWKELEYSEDKINEAKAKLTEAVKKIRPKLEDVQFFLGKIIINSFYILINKIYI